MANPRQSDEHCINGHLWADDNATYQGKRRRCRTCQRESEARSRNRNGKVRTVLVSTGRLGEESRFWENVDLLGDCWEWRGGIRHHEYGNFTDGSRKGWLAHRYSYVMFYGTFPEELLVCHHCDNPPCVRPDHLFLGTSADNVYDIVQKGRHHIWKRGGYAALTHEDIEYIQASGETQTSLAERFEVNRTTIRKIQRGEYQWLP